MTLPRRIAEHYKSNNWERTVWWSDNRVSCEIEILNPSTGKTEWITSFWYNTLGLTRASAYNRATLNITRCPV